MPTIDWNARWVMLTGGWSAAGIVSSPGTGLSNEFRAMSDPILGMSIAPWTLPSIRTPPRRSGAGCSVVVASSNAASFDGCVSPTRRPRMWPMNGCTIAATVANTNGTVKPSRWWASTRPLSMPAA